MRRRVILNQMAYFGRGALAELVPELQRRGFAKAFVVTDAVLIEVGTAARVTDLLDRAGFPYQVFSDVAPNPPVESVLAGVAAFQESGADVIIGLGGGSPQDTGKAIGIIANNPEFSDVLSLEGAAPTKNPSVPIVGIPTTAGTASETTIHYVISDKKNNRKFACVDPHDIPVLAIVDPDLMHAMPRALKVATGLDALTHAIEGYITRDAWEFSDAILLKAIQMIAMNLRAAAEGDPKAVEAMSYASYMAGIGFSNVGLGLVHGMAHPLSGRYNAPHGLANGILLATVMEYNAEYTGDKYRDIAAAFGMEDAYECCLDEARRIAVASVRDLVSDLGNPTSIAAVGATEDGLDGLADDAIVDVNTPGNPRPVSREDVRRLYASLL